MLFKYGWLPVVALIAVALFAVYALPARADEAASAVDEINIERSMTLGEVSERYGMPLEKLADNLDVTPARASTRSIGELGIPPMRVQTVIRKYLVHERVEASKDWMLIFAKFALWITVVAAATVFLVRRKVTTTGRLIYMAAGVLVFGVLFGPDPNPMGTVKDAVVLYAREDMVFPPRMIALGVFLLMVFVSNKSICGWGCQFGMLQDMVGRIGPKKKPKLPFWLTGFVRAGVFLMMVVTAFLIMADFIGAVDPFRIFRLDFTTAAMVFIPLVLVLSLFYYRPWCQLACPFGFAGWLVEQFSLLAPRIDRDKCVKCELCTITCPTQAMRGRYDDDAVLADCFACSECINACPAEAIKWGRR